jgi:hypothetical protein
MMNVSLARIMYGTNEDLHAPHSMNATGIPSPVHQPGGSGTAGKAASAASGTLGGLLHRAWAALHHKD